MICEHKCVFRVCCKFMIKTRQGYPQGLQNFQPSSFIGISQAAVSLQTWIRTFSRYLTTFYSIWRSFVARSGSELRRKSKFGSSLPRRPLWKPFSHTRTSARQRSVLFSQIYLPVFIFVFLAWVTHLNSPKNPPISRQMAIMSRLTKMQILMRAKSKIMSKNCLTNYQLDTNLIK